MVMVRLSRPFLAAVLIQSWKSKVLRYCTVALDSRHSEEAEHEIVHTDKASSALLWNSCLRCPELSAMPSLGSESCLDWMTDMFVVVIRSTCLYCGPRWMTLISGKGSCQQWAVIAWPMSQ